ncbi:LCB5 Sphingosine kinase and enzymes related to eukaryotic diacylglycerol kinase [Candidatus Pelagibacterales bacterium]|jgi:YegS/Rv2252/BmrU family lipid kinase
MKKICIIYNSKISLFNKFLLNRIVKILKKDSHVETFATERIGHATLLCRVHIKKFDIIVAAGGDGTINEIINGMDDKTSLGIIPLGTANIGAYEANINKNPSKVAEIILSGKIKKIHIQEANNRKFFLMTGVGYDASVVETVQSNLLLKKILGKLLFFIISIAKLIYFKKYELRILANNKIYLANWVIVTNAKHYGGSFQLTKDTDIFEKRLITYLFINLSRFDVIKNLFKIIKKRNLEENNKVIKIISDDIFINSKSKVPIQCDGEFIGNLPLQIKNSKKTINLLVKDELNIQADQ